MRVFPVHKIALSIILAFFNFLSTPAQDLSFHPVPFTVSGDVLQLALAGGLNNPQFSEVDLDHDGINDLFIFDRTGNVGLTFRNMGTPGIVDYIYAPEFEDNFPSFTNWMLLRDYNCDGIQDVFGYSQEPGIPGVEVHRGYYDANDEIAFVKVLFPNYFYDILWFPTPSNFPSNLFVRNIDIPDFIDVDEDGDLDVLTFDQSGAYGEYYQNQSADMGFGCDSLIFRLVDNCWGRFQESGTDGTVLLSPSEDSCINRSTFIGQGFSPGLHVGSTVLALDLDGDLDKELIFGDAALSNIAMVTNGLHPDTAFMVQLDPTFPSYDTPIDMSIFPAAFYLDVNNDGHKDLLAAPNERLVSENYYCSHLYLNTTNNTQPIFNFQSDSFLVDQMVDLGSGSAPVFFDHNGNGLKDIVVGTRGYFPRTNGHDARLFLFENTGTTDNPEYTLTNDNYAGLAGFNLQSFQPAFGDLDNDLDLDMLVGEEEGTILYLENMDSGNGIASFSTIQANYAEIDVGDASCPVVVDLNNDDLPDLVVGERNGNLNYFENTGSPGNPAFTLINDFLGEVDTRDPGFLNGYSQPVFIEEPDGLILMTGSESGSIDRYTNLEDSLVSGSFLKETGDFGSISAGHRLRLSIADINNDGGPEYIFGNLRGGLGLYSIDDPASSTIPDQEEGTSVFIYPNPAGKVINLRIEPGADDHMTIQIFDSLGKSVVMQSIIGNAAIPVNGLSNGIYFIQFSTNTGSMVRKFIKAD